MPRHSRTRPLPLPQFSLGWELEACRSASRLPANGSIIAEHDGSVNGAGREYKIAPEFVNRIEDNLEALRQLTADRDLNVDTSCGFHVHIGISSRATTIQRTQWAGNFVVLAKAIEAVAFQSVPESRRSNTYCRRWTPSNQAITQFRYSARKYANTPMRYHWINVVEMFRPGGIGTVEIRLLGNTKRFAYLLGWIGACHLMAAAAWRMIGDPSLLQFEAEGIRQRFTDIQNTLYAPSSNDVAYRSAVTLAHGAGLPTNLEYWLDTALPSENVRDERVRNQLAAHIQALAEEVDRCHAEAYRMNVMRRDRMEALERERVAALERAERATDELLRRNQGPVVTGPLAGFDPNAFEIVSTRR